MSHFSHLPPVEVEERDVSVAPIVRTAVLVLVVTAGSAAIAWGYFRFLQAQADAQRRPRPAIAQHEPGRRAPLPQLQERPFADVQALVARQRTELHAVGWIDRDQGVAHLPIERAMALYAERAAQGHAADPFTLPVAAPSVAPGARP